MVGFADQRLRLLGYARARVRQQHGAGDCAGGRWRCLRHGRPLSGFRSHHQHRSRLLAEAYLSDLDQALGGAHAAVDDRERSNLVVSVMRGDQRRWEALSLNEMALHREPLTSMCHFEIAIGRHAPVDIAADGVILSAPGSTAYALSAGGPVISQTTPCCSSHRCPHSWRAGPGVQRLEPVTVFGHTGASDDGG